MRTWPHNAIIRIRIMPGIRIQLAQPTVRTTRATMETFRNGVEARREHH
jgi:hypothetical protein